MIPPRMLRPTLPSCMNQLKITAAQTDQWNAVAGAMRDNAKTMSDLMEKRKAAAPNASAVDDLQAYQEMAQAHADGLKQLVPAFQALYAALSDDQKKTADKLFQHAHHHHGHMSHDHG